MSLTIGSLCSGYGGLEAAVESVFGARTVWCAENEASAAAIHASHWDIPNHDDITSIDWPAVEPVDIVTAGYPCQPFSHDGRRKGTDDERHLWPHVAEAVRRLRPGIVVLENVAGHRSLGLDRVLGELAEARYDARWASVRASDVGAPHRRERIFIVAADAGSEAVGLGTGLRAIGPAGQWRGRPDDDAAPDAPDAHGSGSQGRESAAGRHLPDRRAAADTTGDGRTERGGQLHRRGAAAREQRAGEPSGAYLDVVADADRNGRERWTEARPPGRTNGSGPWTDVAGSRADAPSDPSCLAVGQEPLSEPRSDDPTELGHAVQWGRYEPAIRRWERALGRVAPTPTEPNTRGGQRLSPQFVEWMMGLPAGWVCDVPISRSDKLKALGNGVVPQQAVHALRLLLAIESECAA